MAVPRGLDTEEAAGVMCVAEPTSLPLTLVVPAEELMPLARMRRWVAAELADLDEDQVQIVLLVATELMTNAHDHAGGSLGMRMRRAYGPGRVRIEVDDVSPNLPMKGNFRLGTSHGRGLLLVGSLSSSWGTEHLPAGDGKTVWAEITRG